MTAVTVSSVIEKSVHIGFVCLLSVLYLYVCPILLLLNCCELAVSVVVIALLLQLNTKKLSCKNFEA